MIKRYVKLNVKLLNLFITEFFLIFTIFRGVKIPLKNKVLNGYDLNFEKYKIRKWGINKCFRFLCAELH